MNQKPTVGRIVHYTSADEERGYKSPLAAMVTLVSDVTLSSLDSEEDGMPLIDLTIFAPGITIYKMAVEFRKVPTLGCWSWPPRSP